MARLALAAAVDYLFKKGFHNIHAGAYSENESCIKLFEGLGFENKGASPKRYKELIEEVVQFELSKKQWNPEPVLVEEIKL